MSLVINCCITESTRLGEQRIYKQYVFSISICRNRVLFEQDKKLPRVMKYKLKTIGLSIKECFRAPYLGILSKQINVNKKVRQIEKNPKILIFSNLCMASP